MINFLFLHFFCSYNIALATNNTDEYDQLQQLYGQHWTIHHLQEINRTPTTLTPLEVLHQQLHQQDDKKENVSALIEHIHKKLHDQMDLSSAHNTSTHH
jgi:hypothetical protein